MANSEKKISVHVCCGINCSARGGQELLGLLESDPLISKQCDVHFVNCMEKCEKGQYSPVVEINGKPFLGMTSERILDTLYHMIQEK